MLSCRIAITATPPANSVWLNGYLTLLKYIRMHQDQVFSIESAPGKAESHSPVVVLAVGPGAAARPLVFADGRMRDVPVAVPWKDTGFSGST